jgi:hypothetical protein
LHWLLVFLLVGIARIAPILFLLDFALQVTGGLVLVFVHAGLPGNEEPVSARHLHRTVRLLTEWRKQA